MSGFWVGAYTASMGGTARGIGWAQTRTDGSLEYVGVAVEASSPSFLAHGGPGILYAVDEAAARVSAYRVRGEGMLEPLGGRDTSGASPCHLTVAGRHLVVSNYGGGTADLFALGPDGTVGELLDTVRGSGSGPHSAQEGPHLHSTLVTSEPGGVLLSADLLSADLLSVDLLSADLGSDRVRALRIDGDTLVPVAETALPPGTGPRDLFAVDGGSVLLGELSGGLFRLDADGAILSSGTVVADWAPGDHAAAVARHGDYLYVGLRGSNRIAVARLGGLRPVHSFSSGVDWPRHLTIVDGVLHVAGQLSNTVASFRLHDAALPVPIAAPSEVPSPTHLLPAR